MVIFIQVIHKTHIDMTCKYVLGQVKNDYNWTSTGVNKTLTITLYFNSKTNMIESGNMWNNFSLSRFLLIMHMIKNYKTNINHFGWDDPWVVPIQNYFRQLLPPFKMTAIPKIRNFFNFFLLLYY